MPFVPLDRSWTPDSSPPAFSGLYARSRRQADPATVEAATIPVEQFRGDLVLVAGGDDQVWPSHEAASAIARRRTSHGLETTLVEDPAAGHPVVLPGEHAPSQVRPYLVGGDEGAAERLGSRAWPAITSAFRLNQADALADRT